MYRKIELAFVALVEAAAAADVVAAIVRVAVDNKSDDIDEDDDDDGDEDDDEDEDGVVKSVRRCDSFCFRCAVDNQLPAVDFSAVTARLSPR